MRKRLDLLLVERGLFATRAKAQAALMAGKVRVAGKPGPCACPLTKAGRTPADFCRCSIGWNEAAFSTVVGKPVRIELEESVLRGDPRCSFRITIS